MAALDPSRQPVLIGIGEIIDRPADRASGQEPLALMVAALQRAEADAGMMLLNRLDSLDVVNSITWPSCINALAARQSARTARKSRRDVMPLRSGESAMLQTWCVRFRMETV